MDVLESHQAIVEFDGHLAGQPSRGFVASLPSQLDRLHRQTSIPHGEALESLAKVHDLILDHVSGGEPDIYEAGGGSDSYLPQSLLARANVTVVDSDPDQLAMNCYAARKLLGDIQDYRFPADSFDLVMCYNVIEHVPNVAAALERFAESLRSGGLLFISAPHPASLSGVITRYSPHWFHVWYYRTVRGIAKAGQPGEAPFPVYFDPLVWPDELQGVLRSLGFDVLYFRPHESPRYPEMRERVPLLSKIVDAFASAVKSISRNALDVRRGDYHLLARKR